MRHAARNEPVIPELLAWVQGHVQLFFAVWGSGTPEAQRGAAARAWCQQMAQAYPQDAEDWRKEGETYA